MNDIEYVFIQLRRLSLGNAAELPERVDWSQVWALARRHNLEAMAAEVTNTHQDIPESIREQMTKASHQMMAQSVRWRYRLQESEKKLRSEGIPYGIMKGGVLRRDYPKEYWRFMSDIDFYIRPEDRKAI